MRIHFIAIGGSAMHNLALALDQKGYHISGSDDEIYEPSRSRLKKAGLLPDIMGWDASRVSNEIDVVILGMHARPDNPELLRAQELNLKIHSYPSFVAEWCKDKKRIVVAGSHGKTTTTSMIMEALRSTKITYDYLVGAQLEEFDLMVQLSEANLMVIEGDEYLSSPIDRRPKIHHYSPHITVLTGIAWDHINVFPTFEDYVNQFRIYIESIEPDGILIYNENDSEVVKVVNDSNRLDLITIPYNSVSLNEQQEIMSSSGTTYKSHIIGRHNYQNMEAARIVCQKLGVNEDQFFRTMTTFSGAAKRLQLITQNLDENFLTYLDFAHAPSKVIATVASIRDWFPDRKIYCFLELHTFSSLNKTFLPLYKGSMDEADVGVVFYNDHTLKMKQMDPLEPEEVKKAFDNNDLEVIREKSGLVRFIESIDKKDAVVIFMTSGNFQKINLKELLDN